MMVKQLDDIISVYNISFLFDLIFGTVLGFRPPHRHAGGAALLLE